MRTLLATLLLLLTLLPAPVLAQEATQAPLAEDPAGDVTGRAIGTDQRNPVNGFDDVDLTGLWLWEDPDAFHLKLGLAHMDGQPGPDQPATFVRFTFDGVEHEVWQGRSADNQAWFSDLSAGEPGEPYPRLVAQLRSFYDLEAGLVWTDIPRELVVGKSGGNPGRGDVLENVFVVARAVGAQVASFNLAEAGLTGPVVDVGDRLPDAEGLAVPVQFGGATSGGGIELTTPTPYRASNGGDGVFVYDLVARNGGEAERELVLDPMHVPGGWNLTLPGDRIRLGAGESVAFQAVLHTTFMHQHGTSRAFHLRLADPEDPAAFAQLELGVHYLAVAQPAGHHDTLFLHTHPWSTTARHANAVFGATNGYLTFNTLEEDPEDSREPLVAYGTSPYYGSVDDWYGWAGCLDPALAVGLRFDLARTGQISLPVTSGKPLPSASLSGRILYVPPSPDVHYCFPSEYYELEPVELATIEATAAASLDANAPHVFEALITPLVARQDYQDGGRLVLELSVSGGGVSTGGIAGLEMLPGGYLSLPLLEYNDTMPMVTVASSEDAAVFSAPATPPADAPGPGLALLALALVALAVARRQA